MRPKFQSKIISTHLEILQETISELERLVVRGRKALEDGQCWLDEQEDMPKQFSEVQILLADEISFALRKCEQLAKEGDACNIADKIEPTESSSSGQWTSTSLSSKQDTDFELSFKLLNIKLQDFISTHELRQNDLEDKLDRLEKKFGLLTKSAIREEIVKEMAPLLDLTYKLKTQVDRGLELGEKCEARLDKLDLRADEFSPTVEYLKNNAENRDTELARATEKIQTVMSKHIELETKVKDKFESLLGMYEFQQSQIVITTEDVDTLKSKLISLDRSPEPVGFTARIPALESILNLTRNHAMHLNCFKDVQCNFGGHYDPSTGLFTAPCDGLYAVSLGVTFQPNQKVAFSVWKIVHGNKECVTSAGTLDSYSICSTVVLTAMKAREMLCVTSGYDSGYLKLNSFWNFSCFMIQKM
nr:EMILIN-1-like [Biomphalaria glabrata]